MKLAKHIAQHLVPSLKKEGTAPFFSTSFIATIITPSGVQLYISSLL